jgi:hypothetical protein
MSTEPTGCRVTATVVATVGAATPSEYHAVGYGEDEIERAYVDIRGSNESLAK